MDIKPQIILDNQSLSSISVFSDSSLLWHVVNVDSSSYTKWKSTFMFGCRGPLTIRREDHAMVP